MADDETSTTPVSEDAEPVDAVDEGLAELTEEAVSTLPIFVAGETPDGRLLTHDADVPVRATVVWYEDKSPDESMTVEEVMAKYPTPYDVLMYVEPEPYDPNAPNQVQPAELEAVKTRMAALDARTAALAAQVAELVEARQPRFPSGLSYGVAGAAHHGDANARGQVVAFFESVADPKLSPSEFAGMVAGLEPPASDDMREVWEAIGHEAKTWQAQRLAETLRRRGK